MLGFFWFIINGYLFVFGERDHDRDKPQRTLGDSEAVDEEREFD